MANWTKKQLLSKPIKHIDITKFDARPIIDAYGDMAYSARTLSKAADIYSMMLADKGCAVILTLAGSMISAGLKKNASRLAVVAGLLFSLRYVDLFWNVAPNFKHEHFSVHPFDLLMPVAVGGAWLYLFARQLERAPLLVKHDPQVQEMEELAAHAH